MLWRVRRGFMLLEAAVALLIISLTAASALALHAAHLRAAARAPALLTATTLAQDRLAVVRLLDETELAHLPDSIAQGMFTAPFAQFRWSARATQSNDPDLYDVRVDVIWSDGRLSLATRVLAPRGRTP